MNGRVASQCKKSDFCSGALFDFNGGSIHICLAILITPRTETNKSAAEPMSEIIAPSRPPMTKPEVNSAMQTAKDITIFIMAASYPKITPNVETGQPLAHQQDDGVKAVAVFWVILTNRNGEDIPQPSQAQPAQAAEQLYIERMAGMHESDYAEHPNATVRYGTDHGPMFMIDAYRGGRIIFSKYADQDFGGPSQERRLDGVSSDRLMALWNALAKGDFEKIRNECPESGW